MLVRNGIFSKGVTKTERDTSKKITNLTINTTHFVFHVKDLEIIAFETNNYSNVLSTIIVIKE